MFVYYRIVLLKYYIINEICVSQELCKSRPSTLVVIYKSYIIDL